MAKKNEAKIKFSAETGGFNDSIKKANQEMSELRAELKLNEAQMKTTGETVEGLEQKHKILSNQLQASHDKTEALNQKVNKAIEIYGDSSEEVSKLRTQLLNAQTAEEKIKQAIQSCNDELEAQKSATEEAVEEHESLSDVINRQQTEVNKLKGKYAELVASGKDSTEEAQDLAKAIEDLSGELKDNKTEMANASKKADELDQSLEDVGNSAEEAGDGFTVMKGAVADLASEAIQGAIGKVSEFIGYLGDLPSATMELRQDMATLTTSFDNVGLSTETATDTWKELYAVFGEDDRAVETANHIARMAESQEELNDWVTITTGVWATYQDSLPVEGLAEASAETAKTGKVTGGLADALNWSSEASLMFAEYMSEDVVTAEDAFNVALSECTTEQERQQLITETLTKLYGDSAETYRETTSAQMEAKEATAEQILAEANLADAIEPVTTKFTELKTSLLNGLKPAIEKVSGVMVKAMDWMQEHPVLMKSIAVTVGVLATALGILVGVVTAYTVAQWAMNSAILANPITWVVMGIIAVIAVLAGIITAIVSYWDEIVLAVKNAGTAIVTALQTAWDWIASLFGTIASWVDTNVIQPVATFFTNLWTGIVNGVTLAWESITTTLSVVGEWVNTNIIQPVLNFFVGLWTGIVSAFHTVIDPWIEIVKRASALVNETIIQPVLNFFVGLWNSIVSGLQTAWNTCVGVVSVVASWVNETIIQPVANFFAGLWNGITTGVTNAWTTVQNVFTTLKNWINTNIIQPLTNFFSNLWTSFKNGASSAWNGIKSIFSSVASFFKNIFTNAWTAVKNVFSTGGQIFSGIKDGILTAFKAVVNTIISGINKIVATPFNGLNSVLNTISGLDILGITPFSWLTWRAPVPQIPLLANGGIVDQATLNIAGEAGPEAIIPIDKLQGYISGAIEKTMQVADVQALADAIEDLANRPIMLNVNGKNFATATANDTDNVNGLRSSFKSRGLVLA